MMVLARSACLLALVWFAVATPPIAQTSGSQDGVRHSRTRLIMLGTGNPAANPDRFGPATVILVDRTPYLVDAGVGVIRRWAAAIRKYDLGLMPWDLRTLFLTHLHSDHTLGYPELILTPWTLANDARRGTAHSALPPLRVFGPAGTRAMTDHVLAAYADDIRIRTGEGAEDAGGAGPVVDVTEIQPGMAFKDGNVTVTAFRVPHGTWKEAFGFRFVTPDKRIVLSGDTAFSPEVARECDGCDILVHEGGLATDASAYYRSFHTAAADVARIAKEARPGLLVLYHQRDANEEGLRVIRAAYAGRVVVANDLDLFQ